MARVLQCIRIECGILAFYFGTAWSVASQLYNET